MKIKKEAKIGIFAVVALGLLYWGINFVKGEDVFSRNNTFYAEYEQVAGLKVASPVRIKGLNIGVIKSMNYNPAVSENVVLELTVKGKYEIPNDSKAKIISDGLIGGKILEIELGKSKEYYQSGDTLNSGIDKDLMSMAGSELESLKSIATGLIDEVMGSLKGVNSLLDTNARSVAVSIENLASITGSLDEVLGSQKENLKEVISNVNILTRALSSNSEKFSDIVANIETFTDSLSEAEVATMINNMGAALAELNTTLKGVNNGEGTLGRLAGDEQLYDSLTVATSNLATLLEDLKANPGRYVQFSVFGRKNK